MKRLSIPAAILLGLALGACSKLTAENYGKLKVGMTFEEVTDLLGEPEACSDRLGLKRCRWGDESASVQVNFVGDKVALHSARNLP